MTVEIASDQVPRRGEKFEHVRVGEREEGSERGEERERSNKINRLSFCTLAYASECECHPRCYV